MRFRSSSLCLSLVCGAASLWAATAHAGGDLVTLVDGMFITTQTFAANSGSVTDKCITAGTHKVMYFNFRSRNIGNGDINGGSAPPPLCSTTQCGAGTCTKAGTTSGEWVWAAGNHCHWHRSGFNTFDLLDGTTHQVMQGVKQAFCLMDVNQWTGTNPGGYDCTDQGVSVGWEDIYDTSLDCQFINLDTVKDGVYRLVSRTNARQTLTEDRYDNNATTTVLRIAGNTVTTLGGDWFEDNLAPVGMASAPSVTSRGPGREDVVWVQSNGWLGHAWRDPSFVDWKTASLSGPVGSGKFREVTVASWGADRFDIFASATDGHIWHGSFTGTTFSGWDSHTLTGDASSVVSWGPNRLDVFFTGGSPRTLFHSALLPWGWAGLDNLGAPSGVSLTVHPSATSWAVNRLDVFITGTNSRLYHRAWGGGPPFSGWDQASVATDVLDKPSAVSWGPGRLDVFYKSNRATLGHVFWNAGWGHDDWGAPTGASIITPPVAVSWGPKRLDVFAGGSNGALWHRAWDNGPFDWELVGLGGDLVSTDLGPSGVSWSKNQLSIFYRSFFEDQIVRRSWF